MSEKKDNRQDDEIEFMDLDEGEDYEESNIGNRGDESWEDEPEPMKPWTMVLVFVGLVVLAAVICVILWRFTHAEQGSGVNGDGIAADNFDGFAPDGPTQVPEEQTMPPEGDDRDGSTEDDGAGQENDASFGGVGSEGDGSETASPTEPSSAPDSQPDSSPNSAEVSAPQEPEDGDTSMSFNSVQESVTPKDVVNLRSVPSTVDENTIVSQASNGEVLSRTGVNPDTGWSRIDYDGQILYAVTQYLTTDLSYKTPVQASNPNRVSTISGRVIIFTDCDDNMTPKEYVNLRTEPSTTEGDATVRCQVSSGEVVHRTGYSADSGWSRVEYNGEVLYVVTSLMLVQ